MRTSLDDFRAVATAHCAAVGGLDALWHGLLNIQGQLHSIAIGVLLILSILLPNLPQIVRAQRTTWSHHTLFWIAATVVIAIMFGSFFF